MFSLPVSKLAASPEFRNSARAIRSSREVISHGSFSVPFPPPKLYPPPGKCSYRDERRREAQRQKKNQNPSFHFHSSSLKSKLFSLTTVSLIKFSVNSFFSHSSLLSPLFQQQSLPLFIKKSRLICFLYFVKNFKGRLLGAAFGLYIHFVYICNLEQNLMSVCRSCFFEDTVDVSFNGIL